MAIRVFDEDKTRTYDNVSLYYSIDNGYTVMVTYEVDGEFVHPIYARRKYVQDAINYIADNTVGYVSNIRFWESLPLDDQHQIGKSEEGIDTDSLGEDF